MAVRNVRNVRPRLDAYEIGDSYDDTDSEIEENGDGELEQSENDQINDDEEDSNVGSEEDADAVQQSISNVSFGALKQAQDSLSRKRKRGSESAPDQEGKLVALRQRLQQLREQKALADGAAGRKSKPRDASSKAKKEDLVEDEEDDTDDSDSAPSEEDAPKSRSSKHAPAAQSSRYQVSRKRTVVDVPKRVVRDPRFDALHQSSAQPIPNSKAYNFLEDYQKSEIQELKAALKKAKTEEDKELLKRKIGSMENRLKAKEAKEREQDIIRKHRKEERELIKQGKTPYYLKKKDIKEKALVEKFKGMKSKDREKLIEKRRRKEGQKEKKRMPDARRMIG